MKTRKYNLFSVPFLSFFSKRAYHDVGTNWRGSNLAYLFLLLAVCCIPPTVTLRDHTLKSLEITQHLVDQIPEINITEGRVLIDQHQPYYITRGDGSPAMIIDTTGSMNYIDDPKVCALLMETSLIVRTGKKTFKSFDLSSIEKFHLDRFVANSWLQLVKDTFAQVSYGIFLLASFLFAIPVMLLASIIGLILSSMMKGGVNLAGAMRIATVAATPSIILMSVATTMEIGVVNAIYLAVFLMYLIAGIKACAKEAAREQNHVDLKSCLNEDVFDARHAA